MKRIISFLLAFVILTQLIACNQDPLQNADGTTDVGNNDDDNGGDTVKKYYPAAEIKSAKGGASGIVVLIHDDGDYNSALLIDSLLEKYGLVADCAMVVNRLWDYNTGTPKTDAVNKWREILDRGRIQMISHSMTHTWWGTEPDVIDVTKLTDDPAKLELEIIESQRVLRELFPDQRVLTFVYPGFSAIINKYGANAETKMKYIFSKESQNLVDQYYISGRIGSGIYPIYSGGNIWATLGALSIGDSTVSSGKVQSRIIDAKNNKLAVIYSHKVIELTKEELDAGYEYTSDNTMSSYYYEEMCKMIAAEVEAGKIWNAHYDDAVLYVREAQTAKLRISGDENEVRLILTDGMDNEIYNYPLTVRLRAAESWEAVKIVQGDRVSYALVEELRWGEFTVDLEIVPDSGDCIVTPIAASEIPA